MLGAALIAASSLPINRTVQASYTVGHRPGALPDEPDATPLQINNVPLFASKEEIRRKIKSHASRELERKAHRARKAIPRALKSGNEVDARQLKLIADRARREAGLVSESNAIAVTIEQTPLERLVGWLGTLAISALSFPLLLLLAGLTLRWIINGFREPQSTTQLGESQ